MFLTSSSNLKTYIIEILALSPYLSADEILFEVESRYESFSKRAVYKELKNLEGEGVVVRSRARYSLMLLWVINMAGLFHDAYYTLSSRQLTTKTQKSEAPVITTSAPIQFQNLARLDYTWMQMMLLLMRHYPNEVVQIWKPEHWFHLVHPQVTKLFFSALGRIRSHQQHCIGHDCFVSRKGIAMIPKKFGEVRFEVDPFGLGRATYLTIIGDYLITVRMNRGSAESMHRLFAKIENERAMKTLHVSAFMHGPIKSTLRVEFKPKSLPELKDRFTSIFSK